MTSSDGHTERLKHSDLQVFDSRSPEDDVTDLLCAVTRGDAVFAALQGEIPPAVLELLGSACFSAWV